MTEKMKIGDLMVQEGYVTREQLAEALNLHNSRPDYIPVGEAFVELGYLTKSELKEIIRTYRKHIFLGELLVNMGLISEDEMRQALEYQTKYKDKKLGQILIDRRFITEDDLTDSLSVQFGIPRIIPDVKLIDMKLLRGLNQSFLIKNEFMPIYKEGNTLTVVLSNPLDDETLHILKGFFKCKIEPAIATKDAIIRTISQYYSKIKVSSEAGIENNKLNKDLVIGGTDLSKESDVDIVNYIVTNALLDNASDIHIEPMEKYLRVRYRIDGILQHKTDLPKGLAAPLVSRIKSLCDLDVAKKQHHQTGRIEANIMGREIDLTVSTYTSMWGENALVKIMHRQNALVDIDELGFSPLNKARYTQIVEHPSGIILATGPAGSGKTTTLYASIRHLNNMHMKIITIEDPVEFTIDGIVQGTYDPRGGHNYQELLTSMLRQDPDVLMIGNIRDPLAAKAGIQAALMGHKVFSTFHSEDTTGALLYLMDMDVDTFLISSTLVSVVAQRLVRILCAKCKERYTPGTDILSSFSIHSLDVDKYSFYRAVGCKHCNKTGFKGRTAIHEVLVVNDAIRDAILDRQLSTEIRTVAREKAGLVTMRDDGFYKASMGITSLEEIVRVVFNSDSDKFTPRAADDLIAMCEMREKK
ncbi:MAG: Flp pilus assembly complex ATPase component TadA [Proteobacteria bacterium]|nr:Flp pilus assembly complex ATPase component TadA [Pseudomonadota bacterium]